MNRFKTCGTTIKTKDKKKEENKKIKKIDCFLLKSTVRSFFKELSETSKNSNNMIHDIIIKKNNILSIKMVKYLERKSIISY